MWVVNKDGHKTFIDSKKLNMFLNKGWKAYSPKSEEEQPVEEEVKPKSKKRNK